MERGESGARLASYSDVKRHDIGVRCEKGNLRRGGCRWLGGSEGWGVRSEKGIKGTEGVRREIRRKERGWNSGWD
eukprot:808512-Rhodomonas_salina.1